MKQLQSRQHSAVYKKKAGIRASYTIIICILLCHSIRAAGCPPDSLSLGKKIELISEHVQTTDESCLETIVSAIDADYSSAFDTLANILNRWTTYHSVSSRLLCTGYNNQFVHGHELLWNTLWQSFQASHKPLFTEVHRLFTDGSMYLADTLLHIYDSEGKIDNKELPLWIKVKTITKDYKAIPPLYCRLFNLVPQSQKGLSVTGVIHGSMYGIKTQYQQTLDESGKEAIPQILTGLKNCLLSTQNNHDPELLRWLSYLLGNYGLYDDELEVTLAIKSNDAGFSISSELADIARSRFINKSFVHALRAGREAFKKAENNDDRSSAGSLVYQSFVALGLNDSALQWIKYAQLTNLNNLLNAINLYQQSGQLVQAQSLINKFPSSLMKDTLSIRQAIFSLNLKTAHELLIRNDSLKSHKNELYLWKIRMAIFNKEYNNLMKLLDSIPEISKFNSAAEVLGYKYRVLKLMDCPEALEAWQLIEYNIYIGRLKEATASLEQLDCDAGCKAECALVVSDYLYKRKRISDALAILSSFDESGVSAEFLYLKAICLREQEKVTECRKLLEKILLDFPDDIYAGKARLIFSDLQSGQ